MRKQFIWIDKAGFYYSGPGNISIGDGSKGSVFFWYHPDVWLRGDQTIWEAVFDGNNYLKMAFTGIARLSFSSVSGGQRHDVHWTNFFTLDNYRWIPVTCTWDFTVPGQGKLRLYVDGQEAPMRLDNAQAPLGEAQRLYLGPRPGTTSAGLDGFFDNFTIWDDVMTQGQHQALRGPASNFADRQNARRRLPKASDCAGTMTLQATFDGKYDADLAGGDATARWLVGASDYNQFSRIDDGAVSRGERFRFLFGMPRHDNSEDDRVPLRAVLPIIRMQGADQYTTVVDSASHSEINISALKAIPGMGQGVLWIREAIDTLNVQLPSTVKMRVAVPNATNQVKSKLCLGPVTYVNGGMHGGNFGTWGTGEAFTVVADAGNSVSQLKTNLTARAAGYWTGAEVSLHSGACGSCRLKVSGYDPATGIITLAGQLPVVPAAGDFGNVDFRGRLIPTGNPNGEQQSMEAWLWEEYGGDRPWTEIECSYGTFSGCGFTRYQRGRTVWMDLLTWRGWLEGNLLMFGRNGADPMPENFSCNILIESLIVEGPGSYQVMRPKDCRTRRGFEPADSFMLRDPATGHSSRVWRWENCTWKVAQPTVNPDPTLAMADLAAPGTWRKKALLQQAIKPCPELSSVIGIVRGTDDQNKERLGYLRGTWDNVLKRVRWIEEAAPEGRSNPFLDLDELKPWFTSDSTWGLDGLTNVQIAQTPDGCWSLLFSGTENNPDHYYLRALHGAADRWSFDPETQWWPENPVLPGFGGVDKIGPEYGGLNCFGNRDAEWIINYNPYARDASRRYSAYARYKTILPLGTYIGNNRRPVAGWTSPDLKSFFLLPHGNALSPLPIGDAYIAMPYSVSDDVTGMLVEYLGGHIRLWASDDDRHFQEVRWNFMPDAVPDDAFRLGDLRVYYSHGQGQQNFAYLGYNRDSYYELTDGQVSGMVETVAVVKPESGWGPLVVNVDPAAGAVRIEVLDAATDEAIAGFGREDCDVLADGVEKRVTWRTLGLDEVTAEAIRLRLCLSRPAAGESAPKVYAWQIGAPAQVQRPTVTALTVEGKVNPAGIVDRQPTLGWTYQDTEERAQTAYQVLVASSEEALGENTGDLWDSGVIAGNASSALYGGAAFDDETTYFWKVRVQNSEGVWSEEW